MREVSGEAEIVSPAAEITALLQSRLFDIRSIQGVNDEKHMANLKALAQQAVFIVQLEASLYNYKTKLEEANLSKVYRALRIVKDQMLVALQEAGLEIIVPLNKPFDEVAEYVDVIGWRHHEKFSEEVVVEVLEPMIFSDGVLVRQGRVIMGAPLTQKPSDSAAVVNSAIEQ